MINKYNYAFDYKPQIIKWLKSGQHGKYWDQALGWFKDFNCTDEGLRYVQESLFAKSKVQAIAMYYGMLKHVLYLYRSLHDKTFPYTYSSRRINIIKQWFDREYILSQGTFAGKPFRLLPFQVYMLSKTYGFSLKDSFKKKEQRGLGIIFPVNRIYMNATRKNGKSEFFAGLGVFLQQNPFKNDARPEIYSTGPVENSSKIIYDKAQFLVKSNPNVKSLYRVINTRSFHTYADGIFRKLPFEKSQIEGQNPSFGVMTEYHLHKTDEMVESFESAMSLSRINSLLLFDTTKGEGIYGVAYNREHDYKSIVLEQLENPQSIIGMNIATCIWEVDETDTEADILNPLTTSPFRKSTPMLNFLISLQSLQDEWAIAKRNPISKKEFLIKKFGRWIGNKQAFFEIDDIRKCNEKYRSVYVLDKLAKNQSECLIAIDLANTNDTNAITLVFRDEHNDDIIPIFFPMVFVPKATLDDRVMKERKPYYDWVELGHVRLSGAKAVDYKEIAEYVLVLLKRFNVKKIIYDKWQFNLVQTHLMQMAEISEDLFEEVRNNTESLSSSIEMLIHSVVNENAYFGNSPVALDQMLNFVPAFSKNGGIYFVKQKQESRIDVFVTIVMGIARINTIRNIGKKWDAQFEI